MYKKVIPTLYANDSINFQKKLKLLSEISDFIHLDFMDGKFTELKSFSFDDLEIIKNYSNNFELHIMGYNPIQYLDKIKELHIYKVLFHFEIFDNVENLLQTVKAFQKEDIKVFLVINPQTTIEQINSLLNKIDGVMIMSVNPGREGQKFIEDSYSKIKSLYLKTIIQIDGGITDKNILQLAREGCDVFSVGSFISSSNAPKSKLELLNRLIKKC